MGGGNESKAVVRPINGGGIPFLKKVEYFCFFPPFNLKG